MFDKVKRLFSSSAREAELKKYLDELRQRLPVPLLWLYGKTQSGKTSVVKFLTGADQAEIGRGFQPCTRFSREYQFPTAQAPLVRFLLGPNARYITGQMINVSGGAYFG